MGDEGLERTTFRSKKTGEAAKDGAHICATSEITAFLAEACGSEAWAALPPPVRDAFAALSPEVLAALQILFSGLPKKP